MAEAETSLDDPFLIRYVRRETCEWQYLTDAPRTFRANTSRTDCTRVYYLALLDEIGAAGG